MPCLFILGCSRIYHVACLGRNTDTAHQQGIVKGCILGHIHHAMDFDGSNPFHMDIHNPLHTKGGVIFAWRTMAYYLNETESTSSYFIELPVTELSREAQSKRLNPPYRPYSKGNPSQVIFRLKIIWGT